MRKKLLSTGDHFGTKVQRWLEANAAATPKRHPCSGRELAKAIGDKQPTVQLLLTTGRPKLHLAFAIAKVMKTSLTWLADPDEPWPPAPERKWEAFADSLTPAERERVVD